MVARPGLDLDPHFDLAGYFAALDATLAPNPGAAPGATSIVASALAPAELARRYMQQWLDRTAQTSRWGVRSSALDSDEALELLATVDLDAFGPDLERALRGRAPHVLARDAAQYGLTVADLVQLVTTELLGRRRTGASGGAAPGL